MAVVGEVKGKVFEESVGAVCDLTFHTTLVVAIGSVRGCLCCLLLDDHVLVRVWCLEEVVQGSRSLSQSTRPDHQDQALDLLRQAEWMCHKEPT